MMNKKTITSMLLNLCFLTFLIPLSRSQDVFLAISNGSGSPGSKNKQVMVILDNSAEKVKGIQFDICDEGNYLSTRGCDSTGRASEFLCSSHEKKDGCANVVLYSVGDYIEVGGGHILIINFNVSEDAPSGQCVSLNPTNVIISGGKLDKIYYKTLEAVIEGGEFCFAGGDEDEDEDEDETTTTTTESSTLTTIARTISESPPRNNS